MSQTAAQSASASEAQQGGAVRRCQPQNLRSYLERLTQNHGQFLLLLVHDTMSELTMSRRVLTHED